MTVPFRRFCLSHPFWYIQTRARAAAPLIKENGQRRARKTAWRFIDPHHSSGRRFLPTPCLSPRGCLPQDFAPFRSSLSCAADCETIQSTPRPHPQDFPPEWPPPPKRSAKQFPQNSPSKAQKPEPSRTPLVPKCYGPRREPASRLRKRRPPTDKARLIPRCYPQAERLLRSVW